MATVLKQVGAEAIKKLLEEIDLDEYYVLNLSRK